MYNQLRFFRVPKSDSQQLHFLAEQYRELRLAGLEQSPDSFSSTYESESQHPLAYWQSQLLDPEKELFICAASSPQTDPLTQSAPSETWIAQLVLRGPVPDEQFHLPPEAEQPELLLLDDRTTTCNWQLMSLYVHPSHRGQAISQRLISHAVRWLQSRSSSSSSSSSSQLDLTVRNRIRAMVRPENVPSQRSLLKVGFVRAGTCTLREAKVANGEIPFDQRDRELPGEYDVKGGHIYFLETDSVVG